MCNLAGGAEHVLATLQKDTKLDVFEYTCLDYCDVCYDGFYALVNGELISGETPDDLVNNIYQYIREIQ